IFDARRPAPEPAAITTVRSSFIAVMLTVFRLREGNPASVGRPFVRADLGVEVVDPCWKISLDGSSDTIPPTTNSVILSLMLILLFRHLRCRAGGVPIVRISVKWRDPILAIRRNHASGTSRPNQSGLTGLCRR